MKKPWILWLISLACAAACMLVMHKYYLIKNILPLEFAPSAADMKTWVNTIDPNPANAYRILLLNTCWDYGFLISYTLLTFFSFLLIRNLFALSIKPGLYLVAFIAGIFDMVENYFLLQTALHQQENFSMVYFWAVRIKWCFAIVNVLLVVTAIISGLLKLTGIKK